MDTTRVQGHLDTDREKFEQGISEVQKAPDTPRTFRNFIRPAVCCTRGRFGFKRRMIGVIELHFSIKLAELHVQKFDVQHEGSCQLAHRVELAI